MYDEQMIEPLIEELLWLKSEDKEKRHCLMPRVAAKALGKIGDKRAIEPLIEAFKCAEDFGCRRIIAVAMLGKFKDERIVKLLEEELFAPRNEPIRFEIAATLEDITGKDSRKRFNRASQN